MNRLQRALPTAARLVLGAGFVVFGLNGFFGFVPAPPLPEAASAFAGALATSGYLFPLLKATEVIAGSMLLSNRFVPLALTLLAPVLVNIVAFHVFLMPAGSAIPLVLLAAELYLAYIYRAAFAPMLRANVRPGKPAIMRSVSAHEAHAVV